MERLPGFAAEDQVLGGTHACSVRDPVIDKWGGGLFAGAALAHQIQRVLQHRFRHRDAAHQRLAGADLLAAHGMLQIDVLGRGGCAHHIELVRGGQVVHDDLEHEAVELRFR